MVTNSAPQAEAVLPYTLRSIYLRNSSTRIDDHFDPLIPGQHLNAVFRTGEGRVDCRETKFAQQNDNSEIYVRSCTFTSRFEFAYTRQANGDALLSDEEIEKLLVAQITAEISVDYLLNLPAFPDQDELTKWASGNVLLHAWPYWREFCHSTMLRMNLPVTMIPLVQIGNGQPDQKPDLPNKKTRKIKTVIK